MKTGHLMNWITYSKINTVLLLAFSIKFFGCSDNPTPKKLIPDDYYLDEKEIGVGKTMVYVNINTNDTTYYDIFNKISNLNTFLVQRSYDKNGTFDSVIFLNYKPIEYYINANNDGELWAAHEISDTVLEDINGKLFESSKFRWQKNGDSVSVKNRTWIAKDTVLKWDGKSYSTIITKRIFETSSNFLKSPNGKYDFKMEVINYICKNVGTVKRVIICDWIDRPIISNLVEIRNIQN